MNSLPTIEDRVMVIGKTGSGKTVGGLWLLSLSCFHEIPYVIIDYKRDKMIAQLDDLGAVVIYDSRSDDKSLTKWPLPPNEPGLYIIRPDPEDKDEMNAFLMQIWRMGSVGLFCDEAFMIPQKRPFKAYDNLLTQGRSLNIPMIMLYQRPVDMSQYATSQAEYWAIFKLTKYTDIEKANEYITPAIGVDNSRIDAKTRLPRFYWLWYDEIEGVTTVMKPVPNPDAVMNNFRKRLKPPPQSEEIPINSMELSEPIVKRQAALRLV